MAGLLFSFILFGVGAVASLVFARRGRWSSFAGAGGVILGCTCGIFPVLHVVMGAPPQSLRVAWDVPYGTLYLTLDPLAAFFLIPIFLIASLAALYGTEYLEVYRGRKEIAPPWFFLNILTASMTAVILAHNAILFLMAWETMALSSFFLVTFEDEKETTRQAGWTYLVASHTGTAFLLVMFILLGRHNGSLDFDHLSVSSGSGILFALALVGFGVKAGFIPLHVWLPEAHPAAPSHISAIMSAVMIKTGIYGLLRVLTFLGPMQAWWGLVLCVIGLSSGILGVLFALAQHDLKRLLAYHSVENIGIIALGLGVGIIGVSTGQSFVAVAGFAGALLHVLNHALFKGLLFLDAGNISHATHTREIDQLGGLLRRMPATATTFLIGAAAISGLPPLNGFVSEFLIYLASFRQIVSTQTSSIVPMLASISGLALIGGLALACFTKAFGIVFLGQPRNECAEHAREVGFAMLGPALVLASGCVLIGLFGAVVVEAMKPLICNVTGLMSADVERDLAEAGNSIARIGAFTACVIVLVALLALARTRLLSLRKVSTAPTWDCGYANPSARMQYTASSFANPLTESFAMLLQTRETLTGVQGLFPDKAEFHSHTDDLFRNRLFEPLFHTIGRAIAVLRPLQQGRVQLYVLYIAVVLLVLLLWQIG